MRAWIAATAALLLASCGGAREGGLPPAMHSDSLTPHHLHFVPFFDYLGGKFGGNQPSAKLKAFQSSAELRAFQPWSKRPPQLGAGGGSGGLIGEANRLFGVTRFGGTQQPCEVYYGGQSVGCGVVYELTGTTRYREKILHTFLGTPGGDGGAPFASLIRDAKGNLYGTTWAGGVYGEGTVFRLSPSPSSRTGYRYSILYSFKGGADGAAPQAPLTMDATGSLYGTTSNGGNCSFIPGQGCGTVFQLTPSSASSYTERVLYAFQGGTADGYQVMAGVVRDARGDLFGVAFVGGTFGFGIAYELTPSAGSYHETVLHAFGSGTDGAAPTGGLVLDANGTLYGTTGLGGGLEAGFGAGTVFALQPNASGYVETILHSFVDPSGGWVPQSLIEHNGTLYGTTSEGGGIGCPGFSGCGTAFALTPGSCEFAVLYAFDGGADGGEPIAPLLALKRALYGVTLTGGSSGFGVAYKLSPI